MEVKRYKRIVSYDWLLQAIEDSAPEEVPVVLSKEDRGEWCLTVKLEDSVEFARRLLGHLHQQKDSLS